MFFSSSAMRIRRRRLVPPPAQRTHGLWKAPGRRKPRTQRGPPVSLRSTAPTRRGPRSAVPAALRTPHPQDPAGTPRPPLALRDPRRAHPPEPARKPRSETLSGDRHRLRQDHFAICWLSCLTSIRPLRPRCLRREGTGGHPLRGLPASSAALPHPKAVVLILSRRAWFSAAVKIRPVAQPPARAPDPSSGDHREGNPDHRRADQDQVPPA